MCWCVSFGIFRKLKRSEPWMASPVLLSMDANQTGTGQKTPKLTDNTSNGGSISLLTFLLRQESKSPQWGETK